jgi:hypothetical protein
VPLNPARTRGSTIARVREALTDDQAASHLEALRRDGMRLNPDECAICFVIAERQGAASGDPEPKQERP